MAIAIDVANAGTGVNDASATTIAVSTTATIAAGFIVASVGWWHASATLSSLSGGGLTWAIAAQGKHSSTEQQVGIAYAQAPSGLASGTTITATYSVAVNGRQLGITSFTGVATSSPVDVVTAAASLTAGTAWTTPSAAIAAGSVLVGSCHNDPNDAGSTITAPSIEALDWTDGANTAQTTGYRIEASAGSYAVAGAWTTGGNSAAIGAAFLAAAGGGGGGSVTFPALQVIRSNIRIGP